MTLLQMLAEPWLHLFWPTCLLKYLLHQLHLLLPLHLLHLLRMLHLLHLLHLLITGC